MTSQFDLEQNILSAWNCIDDIKLVMGGTSLSKEMEAVLIMTELRFDRLFKTFESFIKREQVMGKEVTAPGINYVEVLKAPMQDNDAGASTIGEYLKILLNAVWVEGEGFNGKRPFGNSCWEYDLYKPLVKHGFIDGEIDPEEDILSFDQDAANQMIRDAISFVFKDVV